MKAEREWFDPAKRSILARTSPDSVIDVFSFILLICHPRRIHASRVAPARICGSDPEDWRGPQMSRNSNSFQRRLDCRALPSAFFLPPKPRAPFRSCSRNRPDRLVTLRNRNCSTGKTDVRHRLRIHQSQPIGEPALAKWLHPATVGSLCALSPSKRRSLSRPARPFTERNPVGEPNGKTQP
jgi:hypothetical protein